MVRELIRPEWIQTLAGENTILANFVGVVFGVFMYFPTLVEVPIAQMFLDLGMHRGPLLAYTAGLLLRHLTGSLGSRIGKTLGPPLAMASSKIHGRTLRLVLPETIQTAQLTEDHRSGG